MPIKFKGDFKKLPALNFVDKSKEKYSRFVNKFILEDVISAIKSGRSPVSKGGTDPKGTSGKLRFEDYSDPYKKAIAKGRYSGKTPRPINLTLTGKMLKSIKSRIIKRGIVKVWFTDSKAKYHNELGAGKSKIKRRLLPTGSNEEFNAGISKRLLNAMKNAVKLSL